MPYQIKKDKETGRFLLYNMHQKKFQGSKTGYKTKDTAVKAGMNFMRYRKENPVLVGNKILNKKKND